jgi:hypothetical protein
LLFLVPQFQTVLKIPGAGRRRGGAMHYAHIGIVFLEFLPQRIKYPWAFEHLISAIWESFYAYEVFSQEHVALN